MGQAEEPALTDELFELPEEYQAMLARGIGLSGEDRIYFVEGRLDELVRRLPAGFRPSRILDFGCGTGETSGRLASAYPGAEVLGVDVSRAALEHAKRASSHSAVHFASPAECERGSPFDLAYTNGVFHHVAPAERSRVAAWIYARLTPGGFLAFFENNPWNFGARWVMYRIPFDRDAKMLSLRRSRRLLEKAGFRIFARPSTLFYFPRFLRGLRPLEPGLSYLPLGAQYLVLAQRWAPPTTKALARS